MKQQIGDVAGAIWQVLHEKDRVTLRTLPKMVHENESMTLQAIGWLAREDKIQFQNEGRSTFVSLTPQERMK